MNRRIKKEYSMMKNVLIVGAMIALAALPRTCLCDETGVIPPSGIIGLAAGDTCVTSDVSLAAGAFEIERVALFNNGPVTAAVQVATLDIGNAQVFAAYALAASGGAESYPRRAEVANTSTNNYRYLADRVRFIVYKPTSAVDFSVSYKILLR
jgi:hypothetical protein